ncbi:MAG: TonB-dependent receptor [Flavobacteriaceae bacterium]|uniref:TonB-dependent receptor n=1 Tax=Winogradskyella sp. SYSU M77433 TaxID=3042722 RepID=UPI000C48728B|nr:TonB-dependent receptor [Winogradskyella sp. SYSU M77433]MAX70896.1 TonB-dependent receptor [Flavobacteriaceae bacterium]MDH7912173.1 TonB-dependent receptor [Winogradskyella sp. SYSU M77433]|tara:strand:+ start:1523 stop:4189 length:2667 start_codon:yes stop_codon:yes gene_type:complete
MKKSLLTYALFFCAFAVFSQTEIKGKITDASNMPIIGANVIIKGSTSGAVTDFDGNFSFNTSLTGEQTLIVSYIGFETFEEKINCNDEIVTINVVLKEGGNTLDTVVLTASSTFRSQKDTPMSISSLKQKDITKLSANSQADVLRSIPGITAEGGGGETATNLFVRGLPSGGQYVFNPLQYDGMPLMSTFGLNSSAHDVYARPDIGFKGVEFVRGGAAVLYGAGSVAGIINYTSKTGDTNDENVLNLEYGTDGRLKTEFYSGGQLGSEDSNTYYAITGFLRKDEGPIDTGLDTRGFQLRANIKQKFENGSLTIHGQFINDRAQFFMPLPLQGGSRDRLAGNDGDDVESLLSGELANTSFLTPGGVYESPIGDGVYTKGGYLLADFNYNLDDNLKFKSKVKYANYKHNFALYVGGNGNYGNPIALSDYVEAVAPENTNYIANYQGGSGAQINGNDMVIENLHIDRLRPMTDYSGEANLILNSDNGIHTYTVGTFLARTEAEDVNYQYRVLSEFNNNPRLVNLSYTDAGGANVIYSQGGLYNRIGMTANNFLEQSRTAFYITDEMVFDKWRFDVGLRIESTKGTFRKGNLVESQVYTDTELTSDLQNVRFTDGTYTTGEIEATDWALSLAGLYELTESTNLYANFSRGFFFPQQRGFAPTPGIRNTNYDAETIIQGELGAKFGTSKFSGSVAAYYVGLSDRIRIDQAIVNGELVDQGRSEQSTKTLGLEATANYRFTNALSASATLTYQNHEITTNQTEDLVNGGITTINEGNEIGRQPNFLGSFGLNYDNQKLDALFSLNHTGAKFTDDTNNVELDAITIARLGAGYTFETKGNNSLRVGFSVFNLFDSIGLTEGNPRAGIAGQSADGDFFYGRPILPRRFFLTTTFNF